MSIRTTSSDDALDSFRSLLFSEGYASIHLREFDQLFNIEIMIEDLI